MLRKRTPHVSEMHGSSLFFIVGPILYPTLTLTLMENDDLVQSVLLVTEDRLTYS